MKTIGIIIGTDDEPITKKYFLKNKQKFECLNELLETLDYIPFDYALYAEGIYLLIMLFMLKQNLLRKNIILLLYL